jgi:amidohydrolase
MSSIESEIKLRAARLTEKVIGHRRHLHQNPELSFQEYNTAKYVASSLEAMGIEPEIGVADTGVVAVIKGLKEGNDGVIALRADMDALPIYEANDVSYKSQVDGVMHACGHDAHTASLLGVADILYGMRDHFSGTVKLIFQPGEEKSPGGASLMIKAGVLENPKPSHIIGQHVMPLIPAGKVGFREGMYMASTDEIYIKVKGKGGHAAMPEQNVDPILIASHLVVAMQQLVSRWSSPKTPSVLSIGKMIANGANNVIPNEVTLEGTFRTMD